ALFGDVAYGEHQAGAAVEFDFATEQQVAGDAAITAEKPHFEVVQVPAVQGLEHALAVTGISPDAKLQRGAPHGLGAAPAELSFETPVHLDEAPALPVGDGHRIRRVHEGLGELFLAGAQRVFRALALTGVEEGAEQQAIALQFDVLTRQHTVENLACTGAQLYFLNYRLAAQRRLLTQLFALAGMHPDVQSMGRVANNFVGVPAKGMSEVLIDLDDLAAVEAYQHHDVGAQAEQTGEAFLGGAQRFGTLLLGGDIANHAEHAWLTVGLALQAAGDLQPVQASIGPADAMAQSVGNLFAPENGAELCQDLCAFLFGNQLHVMQLPGHRAIGVETKQCLGAARPVHLATADVPVPGTEMGAVQR